MAGTPRSSFIPKQTPGAVPSRVRKRKRFHVLGFLATVSLVGSVLLAGGTYFYTNYVTSQLESEKVALTEERNRFSESNMASVRDIDRRLSAALVLLDNHISPSKFFDTLELNTQTRVQFTDLKFTQRPSHDVTLTIIGGTEEFKTVALQAFQFSDDPIMKDSVFTDLGTTGSNIEEVEEAGLEVGLLAEEDHTVSFKIKGNIAASTILYDGIPTLQSENIPNADNIIETVSGDFGDDVVETENTTDDQPAEDNVISE